MLEVHVLEQFLLETLGEGLHVHVVAVSSSFAAAVDILFAFGVKEIGHRGEDGRYFLATEESAIDVVECIFRVFFIAVFDIDISDDVVSQVVNNNHIFDFPILTHLFEDILKKLFESNSQ
jgi:hypothetical protein